MQRLGAPSCREVMGCLFLLALATLTAMAGQERVPHRSGSVEITREGVPYPSPSGKGAKQFVGSEKCRSCHAAIFDTYSRTSMARTSGPAFRGLIPGTFTHRPSSVAYRVTQAEDQVYLEYRRTDKAAIHGIEELKYFLGSGKHGRAYLFTVDGYLFQSPVNYYSDPGHWDMSPGYQNVREMPLNHAVERSCLFCHTSQVATPERGTANRYPLPPFAEHGVSCEQCHGPGSAHIAGKGSMFTPSSSDPQARDSICEQCHLEGDSTVAAPGKDLYDFRPGDHLSTFISVFTIRRSAAQTPHAAGHFESLALSQCKTKSGSRMSCLSCHNPHWQPTAQERVGHYRAKCLVCHTGNHYAAEHHPEQQDCTVCHMPRLRSPDASHAMLTDHRIPRRPRRTADEADVGGKKTVEAFLGPNDPRSIGLAYAQLAETDESFAESARSELQAALDHGARDADVLTRLAFLEQEAGEIDKAEKLYREALALDPFNRTANANLAVVYAQQGDKLEAIRLWSRIFEPNPFLSEVGVNLAFTLCATGNQDAAEKKLATVLHFNPDYRRAQQLSAAISTHSLPCIR
jgi:Cytochrome c554 and c-prime